MLLHPRGSRTGPKDRRPKERSIKANKKEKGRTERVPRARLEVDERRGQLLALGLAMFSERSYDEVSMEELARAAGISKGLVYHYFPTKRDLYVAGLGEAAHQLLHATEVLDKTASPEAQIRHGLEAYLDFVEQRGPAYLALMRGGIGSDPEVAAVLESTRTKLAERILAQIPPIGDHEGPTVKPILRLTVRGWIGFVEATSIDWLAHGDGGHDTVSRDELIRLAIALLMIGVERSMTPDALHSP